MSESYLKDYVVINENDDFNFIYKFNENGITTESSFGTDILEIRNDVYMSCFDFIDYLNKIKDSYNNYSSIISQFKKDYHRQCIHLNGVYITEDVNLFINNLKTTIEKHEYKNSIFDMSFYELVTLLCCQSSFALPYTILHNFYKLNNCCDCILVSEQNSKSNRHIRIKIDDNCLFIEMNATLYIKNITQNVNTHKIDISIACQFHKKMDIKDPHLCILTWILTKQK
jgi:hypothetical protein